MPNRTAAAAASTNAAILQRNTMIDLLTRVPVNRGGLLKSIDHLLKTIETSENAVMIPTLLKDKVRVDAWELLFVAKILKASVLGHSDLVEFYLNHIHTNSSHGSAAAVASGAEPSLLSPSPPMARQQSSPNMSGVGGGGSPLLSSVRSHAPLIEGLVLQTTPQQGQQAPAPSTNGHSSSASASSSVASAATASTTKSASGQKHSSSSSSGRQSASSVSWTTAAAPSPPASASSSAFGSCTTSGATSASPPSSSSSSSASSSSASSSCESSSDGGATLANGTTARATILSTQPPRATFQISDCSPPLGSPNSTASNGGSGGPHVKLASTPGEIVVEAPAPASSQDSQVATSAVAAAPAVPRPPARHPQPPSLLQLTTTNNHINSVSELFSTNSANSPLSPSLEQLTNHLIQLQQQSQHQHQQVVEPHPVQTGLSITTNGQHLQQQQNGHTEATISGHLAPQPSVAPARHEPLRSSRSAGCLFRANSGASSPRTPGTPYPQAETLAPGLGPQGLAGDPSLLVKLLLQVEQLKTSIVQVTGLLDSVVDLYKKSIDNIAS